MIPHIIALTGPTASGKTKWAVELAEKFNLEIISADSRQVYRKLDIGTGKDLHVYNRPTKTIPYHLIDIVDPTEVYNLFRYQQDCYDVIQKQTQKGCTNLLLVGGSGMYLEAVLKNYQLSDVPEHPEFRLQCQKESQDNLKNKLKKRDPLLFNKTDITSKKRIIRSLEIVEFSKASTPVFREPPKFTFDLFCLDIPRSVSYANINQRLTQRIKQGMIQEVQSLLDLGISPQRLTLLGLEYKIISHHLIHQTPQAQMEATLAQAIRRMAKQQMTWFRGFGKRGISAKWINPETVCKLEESIQL